MNSELPSSSTIPKRTIAQAIAQFNPGTPRHPLIRVEGEIGDLSRAQSGHSYFTLSDSQGSLPCVLWKGVAQSLSVAPRDGLLVSATCWIQKSTRHGFELDIRDLESVGTLGPRSTALQELREKFAAEGLFDASRKRPLPTHPTCLGVVTSICGDVIHDILRVVRRRSPGLFVHTVSTRVTGEGAAEEIAAAIRSLSAAGTASLILVARGGGSAGDLAAYNSEAVVRAVAECAVPLVTAIGHEPDMTLADEAADLRCATPSEAAEIITADDSPAQALETASELSLRTGPLLVTLRFDPTLA